MTPTEPLLWYLITFSSAFFLLVFFRNRSSKLRPPGPPGWPIIGNILDIGMTPHYNLYKLRSKYGPVLWLKLGIPNALVVQSAKAAEELFKKHDQIFSDRTVPHSITACDHDKGTLVFARYGDYWRVVRKLCAHELLVPKKVSASASARATCQSIMLKWIKEDSAASLAKGGSGEIHLDRYLMLMTFNLIGNFTISRDILDSKSEKGNEFYECMNKFTEFNGEPNIADSFPFLRWFDPQGIKRNSEKYLEKLINIVGEFVKERIEENKLGKEKTTRDFLDALLECDEKGVADKLSMRNVTTIILEMFMAGTETTSSTINWGMAELLHKPETFRKVRDEIEQIVGLSRMVQEADLNKLPYLDAVVKETMRLHPSLPMLLPRNSMQDTEFMGYFIPKNTIVLINAWAIQRDPDVWEDPLSFKPERFIESNIDAKGKHFELIPFGSGRRSCIGMSLGEKTVGLTLANLVHSFDWKLPGNESPEEMDMRERNGIAVRKLVPLKVIPVERKFEPLSL